ncbi:voltage-dependent anion-selective channel protein 2-like isoform X2 [Panonychus citri]|uniref:voltage-dependent anion-selective channel protein 2-like isoform X2 n=1 Tax=Panonychus citri TaxID=50023 RepID=UPI00230705B7|nr:voltage-dependent anion-selective channel protein 2-like isoform X2 [Panonychus citri]XP_053201702.1 voltage-dependent anion-selective channel protein 2-like isoform X2 [Panonychus citri]
MTPPAYHEFGNQAKDIFNKHYHLGLVKLDVKTKTPSGLAFNVSGSSNNETNKVLANVEANYTHDRYGLTMKEKWDCDNNLSAEISHRDKLIKGLTLGGRNSVTLDTKAHKGSIFVKCQGDLINLASDVEFTPSGTMVNGSAVIGAKEFLFGSQVSYDPSQKKLVKTNFSIGYNTIDYAVHGSLNEKNDFNGSIYHKVNESLESAVSVGWSADNASTKLALGCVYKLDNTSSLRAKINNNSNLSLGLSHKLRPGILVTMSSMFDLKNLHGGGHKIGLGIELNAT